MSDARQLYALRDLNGDLVGPLTLQKVQELVRSRRVSDSASLAVVGKPFRPLVDYPELKDVLFEVRSSASFDVAEGLPPEVLLEDLQPMRVIFPENRAAPAMQAPTFAGQLEDVPVPRLLFGLHAHQSSGRLLLTAEDQSQRQLFFVRGVPQMLPSLSDPEDLVQRLVERRIAPAQQLRELAQRATRPGTSFLGHQLVAMGIVDPYTLCEVYIEQLSGFVIDSFFFRRGRFLFFASEKPQEAPIPLQVQLLSLIKAGVFHAYLSKRLQWYLEPYYHCQVSIAENESVSLDDLKMTPQEARLYNQAKRGRSTLWELIRAGERAGGIGFEDIQRFLFFLAELEVLLLNGQVLGDRLQDERLLLGGSTHL